MGVSGCGKSTVGAALGRELQLPFVEGDDFHPATNVQKMRAGVALDSADREPWIDALVTALRAYQTNARYCAVLACSALTKQVRERLSLGLQGAVSFVHLRGESEQIRTRMQQRSNHFMPLALLDTQLAALQLPNDAIEIDIALPLEQQLTKIAAELGMSSLEK